MIFQINKSWLAGALLAASVALASTCENVTVTQSLPSDSNVALESYSYCGGYLAATAYIKNLAYDKLITLYWTNANNQSTPLNAGSFNFAFTDTSNSDWEHWSLNVSVVPDGANMLLNLTYETTALGGVYLQELNLDIEATGAPAPSEVMPPVYTPYASPKGFSNDITKWIEASKSSQAAMCLEGIFNNINVEGAANGTVIAAQSYEDPDYAYNWVRDASLTMNVVADLYEATPERFSRSDFYADILLQYAKAGADEQNNPDTLTGLGEPKFYLNGSAFTGPWGRPQNDGPASRASTLMQFSESFLAKGGDLDIIKEKVYDSEDAPVKRDLEFVLRNWTSPTFDLWEEEESTHFYDRMVQRRALVRGAKFAKKMGDDDLSSKLSNAVEELTETLSQFWDPLRQLLLYEYGPVLRGKSSYKDIAVVLGVLHGYSGDGVFSYTNDQILVTAYQVATSFLDIYGVAGTTQDSDKLPLGIPVGRYPEDVYNGTGTSEGNPWYLTTSAMAELLYKAAAEYISAGEITISSTSEPFWKYFAPKVKTASGHIYKKGGHVYSELIESLEGWGDAFLRRVKYHVPEGGHMTEEFNRDSGEPQGAKDLTWSYAALLSASMAREELRGNRNYALQVAMLDVALTH
ncbi:hypothetical protein TRVA0_067S00100 [Trichomonascus vanleenenianus]|uniref:glycoside hydrolase family 15 protein n=1 Tax=Trichomonascus vanleenenianus TaxID=2268995 RepID=UPI003EC97EFD